MKAFTVSLVRWPFFFPSSMTLILGHVVWVDLKKKKNNPKNRVITPGMFFFSFLTDSSSQVISFPLFPGAGPGWLEPPHAPHPPHTHHHHRGTMSYGSIDGSSFGSRNPFGGPTRQGYQPVGESFRLHRRKSTYRVKVLPSLILRRRDNGPIKGTAPSSWYHSDRERSGLASHKPVKWFEGEMGLFVPRSISLFALVQSIKAAGCGVSFKGWFVFPIESKVIIFVLFFKSGVHTGQKHLCDLKGWSLDCCWLFLLSPIHWEWKVKSTCNSGLYSGIIILLASRKIESWKNFERKSKKKKSTQYFSWWTAAPFFYCP